ncbi:MAG: hypothetical protein Kow006_22200 [Gammaproteobacteria bacterium]
MPELTRRQFEELLPAYVNGTATGEERAQVDAYLERHPDARGELQWVVALRQGMQRLGEGGGPGELGWRRLKRDVSRETRRKNGAGVAWWKPAMAAALLVIVVQTALLVDLAGTETAYQPLGGGSDGVTLQIRFQPEATEAQIRQLLRELDAELVAGPSAIGLYRLRITSNRSANKPIGEVIEALRARSDVVAHAGLE